MRNLTMKRFLPDSAAFLGAVLLTGAVPGFAANEPTVLVVIDANRGALVRWALPARLPAAFQVQRVTGGTQQVIATVKPGENRLAASKARRGAVMKYIEDSAKAAAGATGPQLDRGQLGMELLTIADAGVATALGLAYEDATAPKGGVVKYIISTVDAAGRTQPYGVSREVRVEPMAPPVAPEGFRAVPAREGVLVYWDATKDDRNPAAAVSFEVRRRGSDGKPVLVTPTPVLRLAGADAKPAFVDKSAPRETRSTYTVTSLDIFGRRGTESAPAEVFLPDFTALDPPKSLVVKSADGKVTVSWVAPPNTNRKGWIVERSFEADTAALRLTEAPVAGGLFVDSSGQVGTTYYYRVLAVNVRDEAGQPSLPESVRVADKPPAAPRNLTAEAKRTRVSLAWEPGSERVSAYAVERAIGNGDWVLLSAAPLPAPRFDDTIAVGGGGQFQYRVFAVGVDGARSPASNVATANLLDFDPPSIPSITSIDGADGRVRLTLQGGRSRKNAPVFHVLRSRTRGDVGIVVTSAPITPQKPEFVDTNVQNGVTYYYRAVALDGSGNRSEPSEARAVVVESPLPGAAPVPTARLVATPFPHVVFDVKAATPLLLIVERKDEEGRWLVIAGPTRTGEGTLIDPTPPRRGTAEYRVKLVTVEGAAGPPSQAVTVKIN